MSKRKRPGRRSGRKGDALHKANQHGSKAGSHLDQARHESEQPDAPLQEQVDLLDEIESISEGESDKAEVAVPVPAEAPEAGPINAQPLGPPLSALAESLLQIGELEECGAYDLALERLVALQDEQPDSVVVLARIGSVLGSLGRFGDAEAALERAHRISPDDVDIRAGMGILQFRRGLYDEAEEALRWVCDLQADHGPAYLYRGEALNRLGRLDEALAALERASELDADNPKVYQTLGMIYDKRSDPDEAALMYKRARELGRR